MRGLMMDMPLLISDLIRHAERHHGAGEIVSKTVEGGTLTAAPTGGPPSGRGASPTP